MGRRTEMIVSVWVLVLALAMAVSSHIGAVKRSGDFFFKEEILDQNNMPITKEQIKSAADKHLFGGKRDFVKFFAELNLKKQKPLHTAEVPDKNCA